MKDFILNSVHSGFQLLVPMMLTAFLPWVWATLRKNAKINTALKLLQIDSAKQDMVNNTAKTVVLAIEEYYFKQLKTGDPDAKIPSDTKKDMAIGMLAEKFPEFSNSELGRAVDAALSSIRPSNPVDRLTTILEAKKTPEGVVEEILPYIEKLIKSESAKKSGTDPGV